jgi:hypothetical protein
VLQKILKTYTKILRQLVRIGSIALLFALAFVIAITPAIVVHYTRLCYCWIDPERGRQFIVLITRFPQANRGQSGQRRRSIRQSDPIDLQLVTRIIIAKTLIRVAVREFRVVVLLLFDLDFLDSCLVRIQIIIRWGSRRLVSVAILVRVSIQEEL